MRQRIAALCAAIVVLVGVNVHSADATSAFDDDYRTTSSLIVGNDQGCGDTNITYTWAHYITDSSTWEGRDLSAVKSSFQEALADGRIGVSEYTVSNGSGTAIRQKAVQVYWTEDDSLTMSWSTNADGPVVSSPNGNGYIVYISCANSPYLYVNSSTRITISPVAFVNTTVANVSNDVATTTGWGNAYSNFFVQVDSTNFPSGYAGNSVVTQEPTPAITGTVDCGGTETPTGMLIYQWGNNGAALLTYESTGREYWSYPLTSSNYTFTIICGNDVVGPAGVVDPATTSGDWVCNAYEEHSRYCELG
jgi:hypothetical protein